MNYDCKFSTQSDLNIVISKAAFCQQPYKHQCYVCLHSQGRMMDFWDLNPGIR